MFEDVKKYIRFMYPEVGDKLGDDEMLLLYELAIDDVCKRGYSDTDYKQAISAYVLHLYTMRESRLNGCVVDYAENVTSEKVNDVTTTFGKVDMINGIKPLNNYHYIFLNIPKCEPIKSSFAFLEPEGGSCTTNLDANTDLCSNLHTSTIHMRLKK